MLIKSDVLAELAAGGTTFTRGRTRSCPTPFVTNQRCFLHSLKVWFNARAILMPVRFHLSVQCCMYGKQKSGLLYFLRESFFCTHPTNNCVPVLIMHGVIQHRVTNVKTLSTIGVCIVICFLATSYECSIFTVACCRFAESRVELTSCILSEECHVVMSVE